MTQDQHFDVASYALGVLDARDAEHFEDHLIECERCAYELESFVDVADALSQVDTGAVLAAEEFRRDGVVLQHIMGEVQQERRQSDRRRLYSLAAAVVVFAMLSIGAFFVGGRVVGDDSPQRQPDTSAQRDSSQLDPVPLADGGPGVGGPDLTGQRYSASDPRTGVHLDAALEKKDWGTQISFAVSNITGPRNCRLVVVHTDGTTESLTSFFVRDKGWIAQPLLLQAVTYTDRDKITHVQVHEVAADGTTTTLAAVP